MSDELPQIKARRAKANPAGWRYDTMRVNRTSWPDDQAFIVHAAEDVDWLVAEVERYREALKRIAHYAVETNHGPVDEWAEAEAFAAVSEIAAGALYYWKKREHDE